MSGACGQQALRQPPPQSSRVFKSAGYTVAQQPRTIRFRHETSESDLIGLELGVSGYRRLTAAAQTGCKCPLRVHHETRGRILERLQQGASMRIAAAAFDADHALAHRRQANLR